MTFDLSEGELKIFTAEGKPFLTFTELAQLKNQAEECAELEYQRAELERQNADMERQRADLAEQQVEVERQRAELAETRRQQLEALLKEMGIDPDLC